MNLRILFFKMSRTIGLAGIFIVSFSVHSQNIKTSVGNGNWGEIEWNPAGVPQAADDVTINTSVTIPLGTTVEVQDLHLDANAKLQVDGNLIVYGNITMANNSPEFAMGPSAVVVVHGNFEASNKINISVSSYLIIYGNFIKDGSENQGDLAADDGNIYIFGEVDPDWGMTTCDGSYDGTTETTGDAACDYGQQVDFEENQDLIPDEIKVLISCFQISRIPDVTTCELNDAVFEVDEVQNVTYEWQEKTTGGTWTPTGDSTHVLTLSGVTTAMSGNQYRVVLRPTSENAGNCQVGFSNTAVLNVDEIDFLPGPISGETKICLPASGELTYSIQGMGKGFSYEWILPQGWIFSDPNNANAPSVSVLPQFTSGINIVKVVVKNSCGQKESELLVSLASPGEWTGYVDSDWNLPSNWGCGKIPDLSTDVSIPQGLINYPNISSGASAMANNLNIATNASLVVDNHELMIGGSIVNQGTLNAVSGSITMTGSASQEINTGTFEWGRIKNLKLNNSAGLILNDPFEVTGMVLAQSGNITSNGNLKLISTATQTALIDGSGQGNILGNVSMQRHLDVAYGYKYISTPFSNSTVGDFSSFLDLADPLTGFPHFYSYDENRQSNGQDASGWVIDNLPGSALKVGYGYAVNFGSSGTSQLVELSGQVNNGQIDLSLSNNNGNYTKGFHLLGNPYPSPIDWNNVNRTNVEDALYFFTAGSTDPYTGTYSSFVNGVSSGVQGSSSIIPSMQGFFVKVLDGATNGTVSFQNSARVNDFTQAFLKKPKSAKTDIPLVRLQAGFNSNKKDALVIYFPQDGQSGFEEDKDAQKLFNTDPNVPSFYSILESEQKLSINALSGSEAQIPLGIKAERSGEMNLTLQSVQNLSPVRVIYLLDNESGKMINLSENNSYHFKINEGEHNTRFELIFSEEKLADEEAETFYPLSLYTHKNGLVVDVKINLTEEGVLQINNLNGQILKRRSVKGEERIEFKDFPSQGVYVVSLFYQGKRYSKKVIIQ